MDVMRQEYRPLTDGEKEQIRFLKQQAAVIYDFLTTVGSMSHTHGSRELSIAKTKLEESVMWATKHITG